jgi:hypothetical protein
VALFLHVASCQKVHAGRIADFIGNGQERTFSKLRYQGGSRNAWPARPRLPQAPQSFKGAGRASIRTN